MVDSSNRGLRVVHEMSRRGSSVASASRDKFHYKAFPSLRETNSLPSLCGCIASLYINTMKGDYLLPPIQKKRSWTCHLSLHFSMSYDPALLHLGILIPYNLRRCDNLREGRSIFFVIAGEGDANAACVGVPVSGVPADILVFQ